MDGSPTRISSRAHTFTAILWRSHYEDWQEPRPTLTVVGHIAYVADPATMTVLAVDLASGAAVDTFAVDGVPTAIVAVPVH